CQQYNDMVFTF
nr:immunoglobulin light chain junction region [Macaca mulatta]MOX52153.1 immunoglobulin light chain junction region [Macaca mulatta]MOX52764.1 immunoglobulin light chain junction region [Macaca mulatta]MOX52830.1 immunoglobulin light chain junction region [Macaca mulatta]MOX52950.1 immunoglobulin light chain junction region [Macaca mulatta]